jgi:hypothetical protein
MGTKQETGYANSIGNFGMIITLCERFGVQYNPTNADISIINMNAIKVAAEAANSDHVLGKVKLKNAINKRQDLFVEMKRRVRRVSNAYEVSGTNAGNVKYVKSLVRKITGSNVRVVKLADGRRDPHHIVIVMWGWII